jgi:zinc transport system substrate-binding protein
MRFALSLASLIISTTLASADVNVIASIKPIHSLVASVMEGVGTPGLIVGGSNSPHTYSLKPSDAEALQNAQVIFWVGHELEAFLEKPLETLGEKAKTVSLLDAKGITKLAPREGNGFDHHEHEGEAHEEEEVDAHIWLDPENAKAMLTTIAETLSLADPDNAAIYKANAEKTVAAVNELSAEITTTVAPAKGKDFIVFHDAYHYFENRFGVRASGAISINPENPPGAAAISALRQRIANGKVQCVFSEPQFDNKLVNVLIEGSTIKSAILDPEGATLDPGPDLYAKVLRSIAASLTGCLTSD